MGVFSRACVSREFTVLQPRPGLVMHVGGKYTTARGDAFMVDDWRKLLDGLLK